MYYFLHVLGMFGLVQLSSDICICHDLTHMYCILQYMSSKLVHVICVLFWGMYSTTCLVSTWVSTHSWLVGTLHSVPSSCTPCQPVQVVQ